MEQPKHEELSGIDLKSENDSTGKLAAQQSETKSCIGNPTDTNVLDLTQSECEDSTYVDGSEKKMQPAGKEINTRKNMKRKAAPDSFNYGGKEDASEPETKPAPKKRKPTTARNNTNGSKAPAGKKSNGAAGKQGQGKGKAKPKSKYQLTIEGRDARRECKDLKAELKAKEEEIQRLQMVTRNLQNQYFSLSRKSNPGFMDDSHVRNELSNLRESCSAWSVKYAIRGPLPDLDALNMKELISLLTSPKCAMSNEVNFLIVGSSQYGPTIILQALLARLICFHIIQEPFFFLQGALKDHPTSGVKQFFDTLSDLPLSYIHDWVSQTLEVLIPSRSEDPNVNCSWAWDDIFESRNRYYDERAKEFISGSATLLLSAQDENGVNERLTGLRNIIKAAGDLSIQLRKQRLGLRCVGINSPKLTQNGFHQDSGLMEPHDCMRLGEGSVALNGKEIIMVIEPAVVAYWTDNDGVEKEKTWAKSVVWVDGWEQVKAGKAYGKGSLEHEPATGNKAESTLGNPLSTSTMTTNAHTDGDGNLKDKIDMSDSIDINRIQPASNGHNSDGLSSSTSGTKPDPMDIVKHKSTGDSSIQSTGDEETRGFPSKLLQNPGLNQSSAAQGSHSELEPKLESAVKQENLEISPRTHSCEPNSSPNMIEKPGQTTKRESDSPASKDREEKPSPGHSSSKFSVVILNAPGNQGIPATGLSTGIQTDAGPGDTSTEIRPNECGNAQRDTEESSLQKPVSRKGATIPPVEKEATEVPAEHAKLQSVGATGDKDDRNVGQPMTPGIGEDSPVKQEMVDDGTPLKDEIPTTVKSSGKTDKNPKETKKLLSVEI